MKIAALAPQFMIEAPEGEESKDPKRVQRHLALAKVDSSSSPSNSKHSTEQETRNGLKRLAEFISSQRRAPEHDVPEAPTPELKEKPAFDTSHEYTKIIVAWSRRPVIINGMARVIADELKRRRAMKIYKQLQSVKRQPTSADESNLPAVIGF